MTEPPLPYFEAHPGRGPQLLMVHGFLSSRAQWRPNLARLAEVCRPVLVELWGHGRSPAPEDDKPYRVDSYVAAFEVIRVRLGADRWLVCGQSFGAGLAIATAIAHPGRVLGLVVTNSLSAFSGRGDPEREATQRERIRMISEQGRPALEALRIYPSHAKRLPEAAKAELVEDAARISLPSVLRSWRITSPDLHMIDRLGEIRAPAMLVNGTWEKRFQPMRAEAARRKPDLEIVDLPGGHSINMEAADAFSDAVCGFIARCCGRSGTLQEPAPRLR